MQFPMNISKHLTVSPPFLKIVTFSQSQFYSEPKQDIVSDENMKNLSKFLYLTLKMHNLSDENGLYSFQDTCLLCKIVENWFETIHRICWLIPRKSFFLSHQTTK